MAVKPPPIPLKMTSNLKKAYFSKIAAGFSDTVFDILTQNFKLAEHVYEILTKILLSK